MRVILAVTCILSALLAEGNALSCQECASNTASTCTGPSLTCTSSANTCISLLTETSAGSKTFTVFRRFCGPSSKCDKTFSLSNGHMAERSSSACCTTDACTPAAPQLPSPSSTPNSVICRSCMDASSTSCYTSETKTCTGVETKCARYSVTTTSGSQTTNVALRGCATPSFCDIRPTSVSYLGTTLTTDVACSIHLQPGIRLLAIPKEPERQETLHRKKQGRFFSRTGARPTKECCLKRRGGLPGKRPHRREDGVLIRNRNGRKRFTGRSREDYSAGPEHRRLKNAA